MVSNARRNPVRQEDSSAIYEEVSGIGNSATLSRARARAPARTSDPCEQLDEPEGATRGDSGVGSRSVLLLDLARQEMPLRAQTA